MSTNGDLQPAATPSDVFRIRQSGGLWKKAKFVLERISPIRRWRDVYPSQLIRSNGSAVTDAAYWGSPKAYRLNHVLVLDGVRGIAVLLVLCVHTKPSLLPGGQVGVDLFFVLSGFLITSILLRDFRDTGTIHIGRFYMKRALRLLPAMFVVVA